MKKNRKKYKKWLIALAIPTLIYFIWGYFGFAGAWIPGKYDAKTKRYNVLWGLLGPKSNLYCYAGVSRMRGYTPFEKQGMIDSTGKIVISFSYDVVAGISNDSTSMVINSDKKGIVSTENKIIVPVEYDDMYFLQNGDRLLTKNISKKQVKKLVDNKGKEILPLEYSDIIYPDIFSRKPFIIAEKTTESYFVFPETKKQINNKFITVEYLNLQNGTLLINGILSKDLNPNQKINVGSYYNRSYEKYNKVKINETDEVNHYYGLFDSNGEALLPLEYDFISITKNEKFALVEKDHKMGIYNIEKKDWFIKPIYSNIEILLENLHLFMLQDSENKKYYIDENGTIILSNKANVEYLDENFEYLIFSKNQIRYKLQYNKDKQKFIWHKL